MAQVAHLPKFVTALLAALEEALPGSQTDVEKVPGSEATHYRVAVVAEQFRGKDHWARQQVVWSVTDDVLPPDERLRVSSILTLLPEELNQAD